MEDTSVKLQAVKFGDGFARWLRRDARPLGARDLSHAIGLARITLIVGLVFLHYLEYPNSPVSPFHGMDVVHHPLATFVNSFILFFFFSAVPLLSLISGWLFFSFAEERHAAHLELARRIRRRLTSLYLPLVFWNAAFLAMLLLLFSWRPDAPLLDALNIRFERAGWFDYLNAVFGLTRHPVGFQFWFVRDLCVTVLVSPLLWLSLRHVPSLGLAMLGLAWMADSDLRIFFRADVVFFFYLGGWLRMRGMALEVGLRSTLVSLLAYLVLVALRAAAPLLLGGEGPHPEWLNAATRAMRLIGVLACWGIVLQLAATPAGAALARYGGLAFFLYAMHFPFIAAVKIQLWRLIPAPTDGWMLAHYLASVLVTLAIALSAGLLLARKAPRCFALMNGGRALGAGSP